MVLPKVGVEAVIEGMAKFESDSKKVNKVFGDIDTGIGKVGSTASTITSKITGLVGSLAKISAVGAGVAIAGIGAGLATIASSGLSFNNQMEQASAKINAFTKDSAKTAEILADIRDEAAKTPFEFQAMAEATAGLLPAAKQSGESIMDLVKDAEVLAASNPAEGLEGAAFALREAVSGDFTSVIERFNLPRSMINKLKEEGLPALEIVRRSMQEMGFDMDLVSALANTAEGRWSTLKDTFTNLAGQVTQPIFDVMSNSLGDINSWLAANQPMLESFASILAGKVSEAIVFLSAKIPELFAAFQSGGVGGLAVALGITPETIQFITQSVQTITQIFNDFATRWSTWWPTIQAVALTAWEIIKGIFQGFQNVVSIVTPQLQQAFNNITQALNNLGLDWSDVWNAIKTATGIVLAAIGALILGLVGVLGGLITATASAINQITAIWQTLMTQVTTIITGVTQSLVSVGQIWQGIISGDWAQVWQGFVLLVQGNINTVKGLLGTLVTLFTGSLSVVIETVKGFGQGFIAIFQGIYDQLVGHSIIPDIVNGVVSYFKKLPQLALSALSGFASKIIAPFENALEAIKEIFKGDEWIEMGANVIDGILQGINDNIDKVYEKLKEMAGNVLKDIANLWGAHSPATAFAVLGQSAMQGLVSGIDLGQPDVARAFTDSLDFGKYIQDAAPHIRRGIRDALHVGVGAFLPSLATGAGVEQARAWGNQVAQAWGAGLSTIDQFVNFDELFRDLQDKFQDWFLGMRTEALAGAVGVAGRFAGIASGFADMLDEGMKNNEARMKALRTFLASTEKTLTTTKVTGFDIVAGRDLVSSFTIDRLTAQKELNALIDEQFRKQQEIARLEEGQKRLGFLQSQIDLLKLIQERGLRPSQILGGLTLGLNASVDDLLTATNNVVEAMVAQINNDLQIHSPSAVMAKIGQQIMAGLQTGIVSMAPVLSNQLSTAVAAPISPMMAGALASSSSSVTNNFYTGGNNINNGMDSATFEARVIQVIRRELAA